MVNVDAGRVALAVSLRFLYPFILMFNLHPFPIHLGAQILDFLDAPIMDITDDKPLNLTYQRLDKMNDTFYLLAVMIWLLIYRKHKDLWYWKVFVPILIFRIWGSMLLGTRIRFSCCFTFRKGIKMTILIVFFKKKLMEG